MATSTANSYVAQRLGTRADADIESCVPSSRQFRYRHRAISCLLHRKLLKSLEYHTVMTLECYPAGACSSLAQHAAVTACCCCTVAAAAI
jgi:hypothetical protein